MERIWNQLPIKARQRLLAAAGYSKTMAYRVWQYQPAYVKTDVTYVFNKGC
jgi:hypothetical protein